MNHRQRMGMTALILLLFVAPDLILPWPRHRLQSLHKLVSGDRDRAISNFLNIPGFPDAPCSSLQCTISSFLNHVSFFCLSDTTCRIIHGPNNKCFNNWCFENPPNRNEARYYNNVEEFSRN